MKYAIHKLKLVFVFLCINVQDIVGQDFFVNKDFVIQNKQQLPLPKNAVIRLCTQICKQMYTYGKTFWQAIQNIALFSLFCSSSKLEKLP
jgi:hypothetical protein